MPDLVYLVVRGECADECTIATFTQKVHADEFAALCNEHDDNKWHDEYRVIIERVPLNTSLEEFKAGFRWRQVCLEKGEIPKVFVQMTYSARIEDPGQQGGRFHRKWRYHETVWALTDEDAMRIVNHNCALRMAAPDFGKEYFS